MKETQKQLVLTEKPMTPIGSGKLRKTNKNRPLAETPQEKAIIVTPFQRSYQPLATVNALGCLFDLRSVRVTKDGLHIMARSN